MYANRLGEFVAPTNQEDWPKFIQWNARPPVRLRGDINAWELERVRAVWERERAVWPALQRLRDEYGTREREMRNDADIFNAHLKELERITKKKVGMGPIGTYGGMALAVIPGFGWFSAAFSAFSMGLEMLMGNKKKKRIRQLQHIMEQAQQRLEANQRRLYAIGREMAELMGVTYQAQQEVEAKRRRDLAQAQYAGVIQESRRQAAMLHVQDEMDTIRQQSTDRVRYDDTL